MQFENSSVNLNASNFDISFQILRNNKPVKKEIAEQYINARFIQVEF